MPDLNVPIGRKQLQILRLLFAHRFADAAQITALAFPDASLRACQGCLTRLHRKRLVARFARHHGGLEGGRASYLYSLSKPGAILLAERLGVPTRRIGYATDEDASRAYFVEHQLIVNRCLIAVRKAAQTTDGVRMVQWVSDPHLRIRFRLGDSWRVIHPDALCRLQVGQEDFAFFFEIDRGTQVVERYERKIGQYARYYLSNDWDGGFPQFPGVRIGARNPSRVGELRVAARRALRRFDRLERVAITRDMTISVAVAREFLSDSLGAVWLPALGDGVTCESLWGGEAQVEVAEPAESVRADDSPRPTSIEA